MLQFEENKRPRKRDVKTSVKSKTLLKAHLQDSGADSDSDQSSGGRQVERRPAWVDPHSAKMKVSIDDVSRLRKLKKTEDEVVIEGADYATRLKDHYLTRIQGQHSMFDWAKPKQASASQRKRLGSESEN